MIIMFMLNGSPQISTLEYENMRDCLIANYNIAKSVSEDKKKVFEDEKRRCVEGSNFTLHP